MKSELKEELVLILPPTPQTSFITNPKYGVEFLLLASRTLK